MERKGKIVVAERKRNAAGGTMQKYEPRKDGIINTITSVQKDNYVIAKISKWKKD